MRLPERRAAQFLLAAVLAGMACAAPAEAVVGGSLVAESTTVWPWAAELLIDPLGSGGGLCSGTLVSPTRVVTAAHCVADGMSQALAPGLVYVSVKKAPSLSDIMDFQQASAIALAPGWSGASGQPDVAVVTLPTPVPGATSLPVMVGAPGQGTAAITAGYGQTSAADVNSTGALRQALLSTQSAATCGVGAELFCTNQSSSGPCAGDSGAPLLVRTTGAPALNPIADPAWRLAGIATFGDQSCNALAAWVSFSTELAEFVAPTPPPSDPGGGNTGAGTPAGGTPPPVTAVPPAAAPLAVRDTTRPTITARRGRGCGAASCTVAIVAKDAGGPVRVTARLVLTRSCPRRRARRPAVRCVARKTRTLHPVSTRAGLSVRTGRIPKHYRAQLELVATDPSGNVAKTRLAV